MTENQKLEIIARYKKLDPLKSIAFDMGIPGPTISNFMRKYHPGLLRRCRERKSENTTMLARRIMATHGIDEAKARMIVGDLLERLDNKKRNAEREFNVTLNDIEIPVNCPYLGIPLDYETLKHKDDAYPTFDRVDNSKGYVKGNVVLCSWRANRLKNDGTAEEHRRIADYLDALKQTQ